MTAGLGTKLREFFANNPDEELTYADALAKFECTYQNFRTTLSRLVASGELETVHTIRASQLVRETRNHHDHP